MKTKFLLCLPLLLMSAPAAETPQFCVSSVIIVPPAPAGEKPYLREDEESGEAAPQLTIEVTAKLNKNDFFLTPIDENESPILDEEIFKGQLITPDKKTVSAKFSACSEDDESITIYITCQKISKIHPVYTLQGTLEFNAFYHKDGISHGRRNKYRINQKIHLLGK